MVSMTINCLAPTGITWSVAADITAGLVPFLVLVSVKENQRN
jgi:hypothetical protein